MRKIIFVFSLMCFIIPNLFASNFYTSTIDSNILETYTFKIERSQVNVYKAELIGVKEDNKGVLTNEEEFVPEDMNIDELYIAIIFHNDGMYETHVVVSDPLVQTVKILNDNGEPEEKKVSFFEGTFSVTVNKVEGEYAILLFGKEIKEELIGGIDFTRTEEDPCVEEKTGYIVGVNMSSGIEAETMKLYINGIYYGDVPPGGESQRVSLPAGQIYEVMGKTSSGAIQIKDIELGQCEEIGVRLLNIP